MKFVKGLSKAEQLTLLDASRYAPWPRFRQRAHAVILSSKRYSLAQIADILWIGTRYLDGSEHGNNSDYWDFAIKYIQVDREKARMKTVNGYAKRLKKHLTNFGY